jgi:hypothetical protein
VNRLNLNPMNLLNRLNPMNQHYQSTVWAPGAELNTIAARLRGAYPDSNADHGSADYRRRSARAPVRWFGSPPDRGSRDPRLLRGAAYTAAQGRFLRDTDLVPNIDVQLPQVVVINETMHGVSGREKTRSANVSNGAQTRGGMPDG